MHDPAHDLRRWRTLCEGRDAPLFHGTDISSAMRMLAADVLGKSNTVSTTRSFQKAREIAGSAYDHIAVFVLDQTKLAQRFRIVPFHDQEWENDSPYGHDGTTMHDEQEEVIHGIIKPLSRYLLSVNADPKRIDHLLARDKLPYDFRADWGTDDAAKQVLVQLKANPLFNRWQGNATR